MTEDQRRLYEIYLSAFQAAKPKSGNTADLAASALGQADAKANLSPVPATKLLKRVRELLEEPPMRCPFCSRELE
jgi:hypothetical protein